jgi:hypothetical protein
MTTKIKDTDIKKLSVPKQEFVSALKKVSQKTDKSKTLPKMGR